VSEKRKDVRYAVRAPAQLLRAKTWVPALTDNVSYGGVFLRIDAPPSLRQLIRARVTPPDSSEIEFSAMVVHTRAPGDATEHAPGFGLQFYGFGGDDRKRWDAFVRTLQLAAAPPPEVAPPSAQLAPRPPPSGVIAPSAPDAGPHTVRLAPSSHVDPIQRRYERYPAAFEVRLQTSEAMQAACTRDLSVGGIAVRTDAMIALGTVVGVSLVHPVSGARFAVDAVVCRAIHDPAARGLALEFLQLDDGRRGALLHFIRTGLPPEIAEPWRT
jgi:hypothetical protein